MDEGQLEWDCEIGGQRRVPSDECQKMWPDNSHSDNNRGPGNAEPGASRRDSAVLMLTFRLPQANPRHVPFLPRLAFFPRRSFILPAFFC